MSVCYCSMLLADFLRGNGCSKKTFSVLHSAGNVIASSKFVWHNDQNNLKSNHRLQVCLFVCLFVIGHSIFFHENSSSKLRVLLDHSHMLKFSVFAFSGRCTLGGIALICFKFHFQTDYQQTLRIKIQGSQGCQKIRKIVRNLKLPIARSTIHPSLGKIKNHYWKTSKIEKKNH